MKKVLLLDTNISSFPIYQYLVDKSFFVYVIGSNPFDFLAKVSSNYINLDYSKIEQVQDLIITLGIDFIVPGCNDLSYKICSILNRSNKYYGIESEEKTEIINNKQKFRLFANEIGLSVPKVFSKHDNFCSNSIIIKPVDAFSGRGVTVLDSSDTGSVNIAISLAESFSIDQQCVIEEFVKGNFYSHSAFISNGSIIIDFIVEEFGTANQFVVDSSRVVYDFPLYILKKIRSEIELMADKLNLVDGLIHTQFIRNNDSFWIIEITRRCPGDLYSQLIELSTGFKYAEFYVYPFVSKIFSDLQLPLQQNYITRHTISQSTRSIFQSLKFKTEVQIERYIQLCVSGDEIKESPFGRIGLLFLKADFKEESDLVFKKILNRELYSIN